MHLRQSRALVAEPRKLLAILSDRHKLLRKDPQLLTSFDTTNPTAGNHILLDEVAEDGLQRGSTHQALDGGDPPR